MFVKFAHAFLIVALLAATGGHWALLQTVAWTNMLANNLQTASLSKALEKTFDGNHPCRLCKVIKKGRAEERQQSQQQPDTRLKLEFPLPDKNLIVITSAPAAVALAVTFPAISFRAKPPSPPPRPATV